MKALQSIRFSLIGGGGSSTSLKSAITKFAITTAEGITITVVKGKLAHQRVDVIVNTTSEELQLDVGAVSKSLLRAAGQQIQVGRSKWPSVLTEWLLLGLVSDLADQSVVRRVRCL